MKTPIEKATLVKLKKVSATVAGLQNGEDYPIGTIARMQISRIVSRKFVSSL